MNNKRIARTCRRLASIAAVPLAMAWASPDVGAQPPRRGEATTAVGTVRSFTTAPRGEVDGAILDDGTVLHWPPHLADRFADAAARGDRVRASGWMETGPRGDTHFEVRTLTNLRTEATVENDGPPPPPPGRGRRGRPLPPPPGPSGRRAPIGPGAGESRTAEGIVERMTTAPKGEVDGAVLDDGTVLHWPPHLADRFADAAARGDRVRASGWMETGPRGDTHFEVRTLTNLRTEATIENDGPPPPRPGAHGPGRGRGPETERRIRDLEAQIDRLRAELDRLRRDR